MSRFFQILTLCITGCFFHAGIVYSQEWQDSLNQARRLYKQGNFKESLRTYKNSERIAPADADFSEEMGQTAYKAGDYKAAEENYERMAQRAKTNKDKQRAYSNLGEARMHTKNYAGAAESYKQVLRMDPGNEKARQGLMEAQRLDRLQQKQNQKNQQQDQPSKENQNQQQNQQQNQNQNQQQNQGQSQNNAQNQKDQQQQQNQNNNTSQNNAPQKKLADKQTERKLDELSRQEAGTKKRLDGSKGKSSGKSARKDW